MEWLDITDTKKYIEVSNDSCYVSESLLKVFSTSGGYATLSVALENEKLYLKHDTKFGIPTYKESVGNNVALKNSLIGFFGKEIIGRWYFDIDTIDGVTVLVGSKY